MFLISMTRFIRLWNSPQGGSFDFRCLCKNLWHAICSKIPFRKISFRKVTKWVRKAIRYLSKSNGILSKWNVSLSKGRFPWLRNVTLPLRNVVVMSVTMEVKCVHIWRGIRNPPQVSSCIKSNRPFSFWSFVSFFGFCLFVSATKHVTLKWWSRWKSFLCSFFAFLYALWEGMFLFLFFIKLNCTAWFSQWRHQSVSLQLKKRGFTLFCSYIHCTRLKIIKDRSMYKFPEKKELVLKK